MQIIRRHFIRLGKPALAALLAGMILLLDAMAACPALHELIHKDAEQADHHCAVTMFAQGKVDSATVSVPVITTCVAIELTPQTGSSIFTATIENLPRGRAPPAFRFVS